MSDSTTEQQGPAKGDRPGFDPSSIDIPEVLPVLPLHGFVFFPGMGFPLRVGSESSKSLIDEAIIGDRLVALAAHRKGIVPDGEKVSGDDLYQVGVVGYIHKLVKHDDGFYQVLVSGLKKLEIEEFVSDEPFLRARVRLLPMERMEGRRIDALILNLREQFARLVNLTNLPPEMVQTVNQLTDPFHVGYLIASQLELSNEEEQAILEIEALDELLDKVTRELGAKLETVEMSLEIQQSVKKDMDEKQRRFMLRRQLEAIRKELGEEEDENAELDELRQRAADMELSDEAREAVERELKRLERIPPSSPEYTVSRNYIDWILDLPWGVATEDQLDLAQARAHLDEDHYGLDKVKKRIIEFLAVRKLKPDTHGPILCLSGPPGVGKTSLGRSVARTLGRKFVRIALGGVHDEAEIRGHRRTYIGALPGRIIQSIKKAGSSNPVFLLDEIDKLGSDFRGDPSSALLEVLDPEQNATFTDHYLDIEFDLSRVLFMATANVLDNIPGPLRDRMEVIRISGYTEPEKTAIARRHLIAKQLENHGLTPEMLEITDEAVRGIIRSYTREAGVRNLEREIAAVCRGTAARIVEGETDKVVVGAEELYDFLGPIRHHPETRTRSWGPGLATGLAWTPVGGVLLFIEAASMKGKGGLILTGKLGDVMKESARAALTYIRSHAGELGIDEEIFERTEIHVHVPEGAIPKDGPSAGVALVSALVSLFTGKALRDDVAMTGEITLRGDVLPVGGITEKVLAALRAGIHEVILPALNEKDVREIPEEIRQELTFHHVEGIGQALAIVRGHTGEEAC